MQVQVEFGSDILSIEAEPGSSVLEAVQKLGVPIQATCGGVGKCRKCQVMIRDAQGVRYALACEETVDDDMLVVVEAPSAMEVVEEGADDGVVFAPDDGASGYGMAIDIGTTTLAAHLHDLATGKRIASTSRPNPQISFGGDVISRISASVDGKLAQMTELIANAMVSMRAQLCAHVGVAEADVVRYAIAGNTVMQHIAAFLPPDSIGVNPFTPLTLFGDCHEVEGLGASYFAPCVAGYVGGDITAGMLVRGLDDGRTRLFLDLGTNGEMALAHEGHVVCCATAAGPVFEGANIRFGMPAGPGAINVVAFDGNDVHIEVLGGGKPVGICGTGIIDAVATLVDQGVIDETGFMLDAEDVEGPLANRLGEEEDGTVFYLDDARSIYITQADVRSLQLAKAAVCAGIRTLLNHLGITTSQIERIEIAGGFGKFLDAQCAARIGLFPAELADRALGVGNTSAEGASAMLISGEARRHAQQIAQSCDYLELSTSGEFNNFYIEEMEFE